MTMTSYHRIKEHIFTNLQKNIGPLPVDKISNEIANVKKLIPGQILNIHVLRILRI